MSIMDKSIASRIALLLGLFCLVLCAFLISLLQLLKMLSEEADETVNVALPNMAIASYISKESEWAKGILHDSILCRDRFVHLGVVQEIEARRFPENVLESLEALAVEPGVKEKIKNNLDELNGILAGTNRAVAQRIDNLRNTERLVKRIRTLNADLPQLERELYASGMKPGDPGFNVWKTAYSDVLTAMLLLSMHHDRPYSLRLKSEIRTDVKRLLRSAEASPFSGRLKKLSSDAATMALAEDGLLALYEEYTALESALDALKITHQYTSNSLIESANAVSQQSWTSIQASKKTLAERYAIIVATVGVTFFLAVFLALFIYRSIVRNVVDPIKRLNNCMLDRVNRIPTPFPESVRYELAEMWQQGRRTAPENLEAVVVAKVTEEPRLILKWRGKDIVNISRAFLNTNGAHQETQVKVEVPSKADNYFDSVKEPEDVKKAWLDTLSDLNVCSQKGLVEMFDSSIGAGTVTMPYGGKYQLTPTQTMIAKLPVLKGKTDTITMMSYGFDPYLSSWSPYHGSVYAVVTSAAKIAAAGGDVSKIRLTFQEYFKRLGTDPYRWGQPLAALLGAYDVQIGLGLPSIGGKDSMSGTFNDIDVPPTLVSFAVDVASYMDVVTPELKKAGNVLVEMDIEKDENDIPVYENVLYMYDLLNKKIKEGKIQSAYAVGFGGIIEAVSKMAFGNKLGVELEDTVSKKDLVAKNYGAIILEVKAADLDQLGIPVKKIGKVTKEPVFTYKDVTITMDEALAAWTKTLEKVFPTESNVPQTEIKTGLFDAKTVYTSRNKVAKPKVFIPVFPGTNCEYDSAKAFERAGADVQTIVFRNMTAQGIRDSVDAFAKAISDSQIIMFPGGFSAGDEPDGSGKFIATAFRNAKISEEVMKLLNERDGLALGICNGFQALIKLGLVPYGEIRPQTDDSPTLTMNSIGRHQSKMVYTKVVTNKSPWLKKAELGGVYTIPISHGEGRFVASKEWCEKLFANGQVATQYVDMNGNPTMDEYYNVNGSYYAIEGITSPDGRVLGKMGHSERIGQAVAVNVYGDQNQKIFESGVEYFK